MKRLLSFVLVLMMLLSLVACGGNNAGDGAGSGGADAGGEVKYAETLVYGDNGQVVALSPIAANTANNYHDRVFYMVFDRLVNFNIETKELDPELATEWTYDDTYTTLNLKLRDDVYFHNGEKLTAEDVKFTLTSNTNAAYHQFIKEIEIISDTELNIHLNSPNTEFISLMSIGGASIVCKKACEADPDVGPTIGTGAWIIQYDKFIPGDTVELTRNEKYWGEIPKTKNFIFRYINSSSARLIALQNGDCQLVMEINLNELELAEEDKSITVEPYAATSCNYVCFNTSEGPGTDENLRKAIAHAINRDEIIASSNDKNGKATQTFFNWATSGYDENPETILEYNPEKAKEYVAKCADPTIELMCNTNTDKYRNIAEIVQEQCRQVGITVNILEVDSAGLSANTKFDSATHEALVYSVSYLNYNSDIGRMLTPGINSNKAIVTDETLVQLMEDGVSTDDPDEIKAIYSEIQNHINQKAYYIPIYYSSNTLAYKNGVKGIVPEGSSRHDFTYVYMVEE